MKKLKVKIYYRKLHQECIFNYNKTFYSDYLDNNLVDIVWDIIEKNRLKNIIKIIIEVENV